MCVKTHLMVRKIIVTFLKPNSEERYRDKQEHRNQIYCTSYNSKTLRAKRWEKYNICLQKHSELNDRHI